MELDMTRGKPLPVLIKFTLPLLLGNVFQQFYNMADTVIVGRFVGAGALAAVGSTGTILFLIIGFAQGITSGFAILTAQRFGAGDPDGVRKSVANGILLAIISTVILTGICLGVMRPLLGWMNTPEDIMDMSKEYLLIICAGIFCSVLRRLRFAPIYPYGVR